MLTKRIIPCLDIKDGRTVKGVNFLNLKDAGDPVQLAKMYTLQGADELVVLDISATENNRKTLISIVRDVARHIDIPFTVGGGICNSEDVYTLLGNGADKIAVNSSAVRQPSTVSDLAGKFGSQCIVVAIDAKVVGNSWKVHLVGGKVPTEIDLFDHVKEMESRGAGEILFTSMTHDGTKEGFAIECLKELETLVNIPIIASGGAGKIEDFVDLFTHTSIEASLAASVFHYGEITIPHLKEVLKSKNIPVRI